MPRLTKYKKLIQSRQETQVTISKNSGVSKCHINLIANGYCNPTMKTLQKLCVYHGCSPNDILDWENWGETKKPKK